MQPPITDELTGIWPAVLLGAALVCCWMLLGSLGYQMMTDNHLGTNPVIPSFVWSLLPYHGRANPICEFVHSEGMIRCV